MGYDDGGDLLFEEYLGEPFLEFAPGYSVERAEGFVKQEYIARHEVGAQEGDALAHTARQFIDAPGKCVFQAEDRGVLFDQLVGGFGCHPKFKADTGVLKYITPGQQVILLLDIADASRAVQWVAFECELAAIGGG